MTRESQLEICQSKECKIRSNRIIWKPWTSLFHRVYQSCSSHWEQSHRSKRYLWLLCAEKPYHDGTLPTAHLTLVWYCTFSRWILFHVPVLVCFCWNTRVQLWLLDYWTLDWGFFFLENNLELKKHIPQSKHKELRN